MQRIGNLRSLGSLGSCFLKLPKLPKFPNLSLLRLSRYSADDGERVATYGTKPQPQLGKEQVEGRAIYHAIYLVACNSLCTFDIAIAKEDDVVALDLDDAMHHKGVPCIGHNNAIFAYIALSYGAQGYGRAATEEGQHTLALYRHAHTSPLEK